MQYVVYVSNDSQTWKGANKKYPDCRMFATKQCKIPGRIILNRVAVLDDKFLKDCVSDDILGFSIGWATWTAFSSFLPIYDIKEFSSFVFL